MNEPKLYCYDDINNEIINEYCYYFIVEGLDGYDIMTNDFGTLIIDN